MAPEAGIEDYEKTLAVLGRYIKRERLTQVCILEVQGGVVIQGLSPTDSREGTYLVMRTLTFDRAALKKLARAMGK
jgi:hypothetical protein